MNCGVCKNLKTKKVLAKPYTASKEAQAEDKYVEALLAEESIEEAGKKVSEVLIEKVNKAIENVKMHFPNYRKNKYFYKSLKGLYLLTFNKFYSKYETITELTVKNERNLSVYPQRNQTESLLYVPGARLSICRHDEGFGLQI